QVMLAHSIFHVPPGGKDPLAPDALHLVHHAIKNPHTHIGHANFIGIRKTERNPDAHSIQILLYLAPFSAGVPGRFLHRGKNALFQFGHSVTSLSMVALLYPEMARFSRF